MTSDQRYLDVELRAEVEEARGGMDSLDDRLDAYCIQARLFSNVDIDHGDGSVSGSLAWHMLDADGDERTVTLMPGIHRIKTDLTLPSTMMLNPQVGALIKPDTGISLTVASPEHIIAGPRQQVIDATDNVTDPIAFTSGGTVHPGWWGGNTSVSLNLGASSLSGLGGEVRCLTATYAITTATPLPKGINLIGTHVNVQDSPSGVLSSSGTIFNRTASVSFLTMTGTHRTTDRWGKNLIKGISFETAENAASAAGIDAIYTDQVFIEQCTFFDDQDSTTVGHMIDMEECWDWTIEDSTFKYYGNAGGTKHAVNMYNGDDDHTNNIRFAGCNFGAGKGKAIVNDASGNGQNRNVWMNVFECKFEDGDEAALSYISGTVSNASIMYSLFITGNGRAIEIDTDGANTHILSCTFLNQGDSPTEYIYIDGAQWTKIIANNFSGIGAATTRYIHINIGGGAESQGTIISNNGFYEAVDHATPMVVFTGTPHKSIVIENNGSYQNETVTNGSPTLMRWPGYTELDSSDGAITATQGSGIKIGDVRTIVMIEASTSSTVSVTNHVTSDPEVGTFDAVDETWVLLWSGTEWVTLYATCTFV